MVQNLGEVRCVLHQANEDSYVLPCHFVEEYWDKIVETKYLFIEGIPETHETCTHHQSQSEIFLHLLEIEFQHMSKIS